MKILDIQKNYYAIIPANVRYDKDLKPNAKLLYGEITALCNEKGYCWAKNDYFAQLYDTTKKTASIWINQLVSKGYIKAQIIYEPGTKQIVERRLYINDTPIPKNEDTPIPKKVMDNNTVFNNTIINNTTTTEPEEPKEKTFVVVSPEQVDSLYKEIKAVIGATVTKKAIKEMIAERGETEIRRYLKHWNKFNTESMKSVGAVFKSIVLNGDPIPVKGKNEHSNCGGFEEHGYTDEQFESCYENSKW